MNHLQVNLLLFQQTEKYGGGWWIWWGCPVKWFKKCFSSNPKGTISPYSDVQIMFFWLSPLSWRNPKQQSHATELRGARCYSRPCAVRTHPRDSSSSIDLLSLFLFYIFSLCSVLAASYHHYFQNFLFFSTMCFSREILLTQIIEELY